MFLMGEGITFFCMCISTLTHNPDFICRCAHASICSHCITKYIITTALPICGYRGPLSSALPLYIIIILYITITCSSMFCCPFSSISKLAAWLIQCQAADWTVKCTFKNANACDSSTLLRLRAYSRDMPCTLVISLTYGGEYNKTKSKLFVVGAANTAINDQECQRVTGTFESIKMLLSKQTGWPASLVASPQ